MDKVYAVMKALKRTALYEWHLRNNGKMVDYCGWNLPVSYEPMSIIASHKHTREKVSLFDVSHMQQIKVAGDSAVDFIHSLTVGDIKGLNVRQACLSLLTNSDGGIIDDTIITKISDDQLYMVVNAGCAEKDLKHLHSKAERWMKDGLNIIIEPLDKSLLALQGPMAAKCLKSAMTMDIELNKVPFMFTFYTHVFGKPCQITRCGYTGEDGFELSLQHEHVCHVADGFLSDPNCEPAGLGARDTLRLESGLCLYGNDINESTSPIEAGLTWTIAKNRRNASGWFPGHDTVIEKHLNNKEWTRKRVGITNNIRRGIPIGARVLNAESKCVGKVTSGVLSPILEKGIGMAYINKPYHLQTTKELHVEVRGKKMNISIVPTPFVPTRYHVLV